MIFKRELPKDSEQKKSPKPDLGKSPQNPMLMHMGSKAEELTKSRIMSEKLEQQTKAASAAQNMMSHGSTEERQPRPAKKLLVTPGGELELQKKQQSSTGKVEKTLMFKNPESDFIMSADKESIEQFKMIASRKVRQSPSK